ncbi:BQ5605_C007g04542 [Microbotryum silenes-dioicae]|uniref:BQ5605_C007g04542 protein n=1 Tax=Microbotryum silenes-dioicae TaxID=796604 RepID=A0A2X0P9P2_9BASI|nr:BQ5605_C007g04542 [Microbotryum silenes-dioicae]
MRASILCAPTLPPPRLGTYDGVRRRPGAADRKAWKSIGSLEVSAPLPNWSGGSSSVAAVAFAELAAAAAIARSAVLEPKCSKRMSRESATRPIPSTYAATRLDLSLNERCVPELLPTPMSPSAGINSGTNEADERGFENASRRTFCCDDGVEGPALDVEAALATENEPSLEGGVEGGANWVEQDEAGLGMTVVATVEVVAEVEAEDCRWWLRARVVTWVGFEGDSRVEKGLFLPEDGKVSVA